MTDSTTTNEPSPEAEPPPVSRLTRIRNSVGRHSKSAMVVGITTAVLSLAGTYVLENFEKWTESPPPPCPGPGCDNKSANSTPKNEPCGATKVHTFRAPDPNPVELEIRYSPRCQAAWGRILNGEPGDGVKIDSNRGGAQQATISVNKDIYTDMVFVGKDAFRLTVCATPDSSPDEGKPWSEYCANATEKTFAT
ncbi:DUF2690 domain-containing protein [Streptomyces cavernicola]|uniref:DUF2690 domain-containing protein n=1 Tax=Streptomyces cavernicola TaxID=3043613 RepID=A0ABT6SLH3_9ACTN|nr:DUF2690 domain-containing protein [Streptomyces sp. B-S-A6]MDI3409033.1 DUF2690 domain-containing protein [Streptomyces sp. B-S-A6]